MMIVDPKDELDTVEDEPTLAEQEDGIDGENPWLDGEEDDFEDE